MQCHLSQLECAEEYFTVPKSLHYGNTPAAFRILESTGQGLSGHPRVTKMVMFPSQSSSCQTGTLFRCSQANSKLSAIQRCQIESLNCRTESQIESVLRRGQIESQLESVLRRCQAESLLPDRVTERVSSPALPERITDGVSYPSLPE